MGSHGGGAPAGLALLFDMGLNRNTAPQEPVGALRAEPGHTARSVTRISLLAQRRQALKASGPRGSLTKAPPKPTSPAAAEAMDAAREKAQRP